MRLERLQAILGHQLLHTADDIQQAALASEHAPRDGRRDAFDTILLGVVQVSQGRLIVSLLVQLLPGFSPAYACKLLADRQEAVLQPFSLVCIASPCICTEQAMAQSTKPYLTCDKSIAYTGLAVCVGQY